MAPEVGDDAPDFELRDVNGENPVRLTDFNGKIVYAAGLGPFDFQSYKLGAATEKYLASYTS